MKYYLKPLKVLLNTFAIPVSWLVIVCLHIFRPSESERRNNDHFYLYFLVLWIFIQIVYIVRNYRYLLLWIKKEALMEINELYIFDCANSVKYYWTDIEEVIEEGNVLHIVVKDPSKYLKLFKNRYSRYLHYNKLENYFKLDVDCMNIRRDALLATLTDYSIQSQEG